MPWEAVHARVMIIMTMVAEDSSRALQCRSDYYNSTYLLRTQYGVLRAMEGTCQTRVLWSEKCGYLQSI